MNIGLTAVEFVLFVAPGEVPGLSVTLMVSFGWVVETLNSCCFLAAVILPLTGWVAGVLAEPRSG